MSINFTDVNEPRREVLYKGAVGKIVHATIDSNTADELGLSNKFKLTKWCVPSTFQQYADRIENFKVRPDDIWLVGFMKSGTTWVHNIAWQLRNNLDFSSSIGYSDYVLEKPIYQPAPSNTHYDDLDKMPSPRLIKSHLPLYLLPKELWTVRPKIIYTSRNPKDIAVSLFHFANAIRGTNSPREHYFELCLNEISLLSPIHAHVLSFWELRNLDHVLFSKYEDLLADTFGNVKRISEFLGRSSSDQEIKNLVDHVSFKNMKSKIDMVALDGTKMEESTAFR